MGAQSLQVIVAVSEDHEMTLLAYPDLDTLVREYGHASPELELWGLARVPHDAGVYLCTVNPLWSVSGNLGLLIESLEQVLAFTYPPTTDRAPTPSPVVTIMGEGEPRVWAARPPTPKAAAEPAPGKVRYTGDLRDRRFVAIMGEQFPGLRSHLYFEGPGYIVVENELDAGGGAGFVIEAFRSLHHGEPLDLRNVGRLDMNNRRAFMQALSAWLELT